MLLYLIFRYISSLTSKSVARAIPDDCDVNETDNQNEERSPNMDRPVPYQEEASLNISFKVIVFFVIMMSTMLVSLYFLYDYLGEFIMKKVFQENLLGMYMNIKYKFLQNLHEKFKICYLMIF